MFMNVEISLKKNEEIGIYTITLSMIGIILETVEISISQWSEFLIKNEAIISNRTLISDNDQSVGQKSNACMIKMENKDNSIHKITIFQGNTTLEILELSFYEWMMLTVRGKSTVSKRLLPGDIEREKMNSNSRHASL